MSSEFSEDKNVEIEAGTLWRYIMQDLENCMTTPSFEMAIKPLGVRSFEKGILRDVSEVCDEISKLELFNIIQAS